MIASRASGSIAIFAGKSKAGTDAGGTVGDGDGERLCARRWAGVSRRGTCRCEVASVASETDQVSSRRCCRACGAVRAAACSSAAALSAAVVLLEAAGSSSPPKGHMENK